MKRITATAALAAGLLLAGCKGPSTSTPAAGTAGPKPLKANPVVVVLDMERLIGDSELSKNLGSELRSWGEGKQAELQARAQSIQRAQAGQAKPAEVDAMKRELYQMQEMAKQEYQQRQVDAAERLKTIFDPLVRSLAEENGWDVVLSKNSQGTIYAGEALDQTDFVLARLNAAPAAPAAPAGAVAPQ
jgi:Skp family chaperone for outer membrane proteins